MNVDEKILALRYARAFLNLGEQYLPEEEKEARRKEGEFKELRQKLSHYDMYLNHPAICPEIKLDILGKIEKTSSKSLRFIRLLIREGRYRMADAIRAAMEEVIDNYSSVSRGSVESRDLLQEEGLEKMENILAEKTKKRVVLRQKKNAEIIGGFRIILGDFFIDATLNRRIENLRKEILKGGIYD